ncbi:MAG: TIGR03545 family protein [Nitrospiraceae bacterium]
MSRWIRIFLVLAVLLVGVWFLQGGTIVRWVIERTGSSLVGAKVEADRAELSLVPLNLTLTHVQVTNPDDPMTNAVEVSRLAMRLDGGSLLRGKVIVEEMNVDGVRLNTPRQTSGATADRAARPAAEPKAGTGEQDKLRDLSLDPKDILAKEDLPSLKLVESLRPDVEAERNRWQKRVSELPDKARLLEHRRQLTSLRSVNQNSDAGVLGAMVELAALREEVAREVVPLTAARKDLEREFAALRKRVNAAQKAVREDVRRLTEKYTFSGPAKLSTAILSRKFGEWAAAGLRWHGRLEPLWTKSSGPDVLVRVAHVSVKLSAGTITGSMQNIAADQAVLGSPMTFAFAGGNLEGLDALKLEGAMNRVDPSKPTDEATLRISGYRLEGIPLDDQAGLGLELKQAIADIDVKAKLSGQTLSATLSSHLRSVRIASGVKRGSNALVAAIASAFSEIENLRVVADMAGTRERYDLKVRSDLAQVLKDAAGKQVLAKTERFKAQLQAAIMAEVKGPLVEMTAEFGKVEALHRDLTDRLKLGQDIIKLSASLGPKRRY